MELLSARGISKYFGETRVLANDRISLSLMEGETRAVVGENGAGKSTLARILAGLLAPDSGTLTVRGRSVRPGSVSAAEAAGIGFVPQVSLLAESLTVAENIVLGTGAEDRLGFLVSRRKAYVETALLIERFGFQSRPGRPRLVAERRRAQAGGDRQGPREGRGGPRARRADVDPLRDRIGRFSASCASLRSREGHHPDNPRLSEVLEPRIRSRCCAREE